MDREISQPRRFSLRTLLAAHAFMLGGAVLLAESLYRGITQHVIAGLRSSVTFSEQTHPIAYWIIVIAYALPLAAITVIYGRLVLRFLARGTANPARKPDDPRS